MLGKKPLFTKSIKIPQWLILAGISLVLGIIYFLVMYGPYSLFFTHVNWIYTTGRDPLQHQLGWEFFRSEPWHFPLGTIETYGYPAGTSLVFLDSIPLMAFFFKLFSPWLGQNFQYFGIWELISVIGQMFIGMLILSQFTRSYLQKVLGASLLVLSPPMIMKAFFHSSLSAHWILLLGILFVILEYRKQIKHWLWLLLFFTAMLIHLYYIPMLLPLWIISRIFHYRNDANKWKIIVDLLGVVAVIMGVGYLTGIFSLDARNLSTYPYGIYSWNLNGFVNPLEFSKILSGLPIGSEFQSEGFSYLGLGMITLVVVSLIFFFVKDESRKNWKFFLPFGLAILVYGMFSLSNHAYLSNTALWSFDLSNQLEDLFSWFRSSGRFIWPVFYLLVLFSLIALVRNFKYSAILFLLVLVVQFFDLQPLISSKRIKGFVEYVGGDLRSEFWQYAAESNDEMVIIPFEYYEHMALYAVHHDMRINVGYFGRADYNAMQAYGEEKWHELLNGKADPNTIYVLSDSKYEMITDSELSDQFVICKVDQYTVLLSTENEILDSYFNKLNYCSIPVIN